MRLTVHEFIDNDRYDLQITIDRRVSRAASGIVFETGVTGLV
jgi:hypothetical protein